MKTNEKTKIVRISLADWLYLKKKSKKDGSFIYKQLSRALKAYRKSLRQP